MSAMANVVVGLVALVHVYILVLEMFLWETPTGLRVFGQTKEAAAASKVLAANQGLYNEFLVAGLIWGLSLGADGTNVKKRPFVACLSPAYTVRSQRVEGSFSSRRFRQRSGWRSCCCRDQPATDSVIHPNEVSTASIGSSCLEGD